MANTVAGTHLTGIHSARPAGNGTPDGTLYSCTTHKLIYLSNYAGNSWSTWADISAVSGFANPMSAIGDIIQGGTAGAPEALAAPLAGKVLTGAGVTTRVAYAYPPGYQFDTGSITANKSVTQTGNSTTGNTDLVVAAAGYTASGTDTVKVTFSAPWWNPDTVAAGRFLALYLFDDSGGSLGRVALCVSQVAGVSDHQVCKAESATLTPAAGTRTYSIRAGVTAGTGTVAAGAGGSGNDSPAIIRVIKVA